MSTAFHMHEHHRALYEGTNFIGERRQAGELVKWGKSLYDNDRYGFIATK